MKLNIRIDREDGSSEDFPIDLDLSTLTMRESVRIEELLGREAFDALMGGGMTPTQLGRPSVLRAVIYAKVKTHRPDVTPDTIDLDLDQLAAAIEEEEPDPKAHHPLSAGK